MLIKGGILGLILLVLFYISLLMFACAKCKSVNAMLFPFFLVISMLFATYVINGLFIKPNFCWLIVLGYAYKENSNLQLNY